MGLAPSHLSDIQLQHSSYYDSNFGQIDLYTKIGDPLEQIMKIQNQIPTQRRRIKHPNLLNIYEQNYVEYPGNVTLNNKILSRSAKWNEGQIWKIIKIMIEPLALLEENGLQIGDIRPNKIFIKNDQIKLVESYFFPGIRGNYSNAMFGQQAYLSPEQIEYLQKKSAICPTNQIKADVYCFGMLILMISNLMYYNPCYNYQIPSIQMDQLDQLLKKTLQDYSTNLCSLIQYTLNPNILKRPTFIQIREQLKPYYDRIDSNYPFYNHQIIVWCQDYPEVPTQLKPKPIIKNRAVSEIQLKPQPQMPYPYHNKRLSESPMNQVQPKQFIQQQQISFIRQQQIPPQRQQRFQPPILSQSCNFRPSTPPIRKQPQVYPPQIINSNQFTFGNWNQPAQNIRYETPQKSNRNLNQSMGDFSTSAKSPAADKLEKMIQMSESIINKHK